MQGLVQGGDDLLGLEVDRVKGLVGQGDLFEQVLAAVFLAELRAGAVLERPRADRCEVEVLAVVAVLQDMQQTQILGLAGDLLLEFAAQGILVGGVGGLDLAAGGD